MRRHKRAPAERSGRFRFIILAATGAAFLLVPITHAAAFEANWVTVNIVGDGRGEVRSDAPEQKYTGTPPLTCTYVPGLGKSGVCKNKMSDEGEGWEQVVAVAKAGPNSHLVKWTVQKAFGVEGCPENNEFEGCFPFVEPAETFEGEEAEITAEFACNQPGECSDVIIEPLPFAVTKLGEGTVVSNPPGINCGATCEHEFQPNELVTLTASPAAGWAFSSWSGCLEHVGLTCKVTMDKSKAIMVTFVQAPSLTIEKSGAGYGKVAATGISCDESCSRSTAGIKIGSAVTVKVIPAKGYEFVSFEGGTGNASSCSATCTFTISEASSVKVKFVPIPSKTLTVKLTGPGAYKGKVTGKGVTVKGLVSTVVNCGMGCTTETESFFATGTTELLATPAPGYLFKGWTVSGGSAGTCTGTTSPCKLLTDADKTVEAKFE